ncbi:hypothetical protein CKA32_002714 [Geitlerinema sp. FC II]|nr:hypothetical protein CKA32_002714 [Geitlerinema sp. FC II]
MKNRVSWEKSLKETRLFVRKVKCRRLNHTESDTGFAQLDKSLCVSSVSLGVKSA